MAEATTLLVSVPQVQGCRDDAELREFANDLVRRDSSSAAARALGVVMAGATGAAAAAGGGGGGSSAAGRPGLSIEDLQAGPGGRHDNDHVDYRWAHCATGVEVWTVPRMQYPRGVGPLLRDVPLSSWVVSCPVPASGRQC